MSVEGKIKSTIITVEFQFSMYLISYSNIKLLILVSDCKKSSGTVV